MTDRALPTLADLVGGLGYELVRVVVAPHGLDVGVGDPIIHDRVAGTRFAAGDVVLAVGLDPRGGELASLVRDAGSAGAAAVVAKFDDDVSAAPTAAAEACGMALLRAARDVEWGQLHSLVRMVTSTSSPSGGRIDPDDPLLGDLFALANAIAARTGGPVTIEDAQSRVLAYSTGDESIDEYRRDTILGRRVPEAWIRRLQHDGAFKRIWQSDAAVRISYAATEPSYRDRMVTAVRAGGEVVGTIWVQEGDHPLGEDTERVLSEVAPLAALHLVRHVAGDVERRQEWELVGAVLAGRVPPGALGGAGGMVELRREHQLAVLVLRPETVDDAAAAMHLARMASVVSLYRRTERAPIAVSVAGGVMHVVVSAVPDRLDAVVADLVARARGSVRVPLAAAIALSPHGVESLPAARLEADSVAAVSHGITGAPVRWDDVVGAAVLSRWRTLAQSRPDLTRGRLDVLLGSDRARESQYAATLRAYLDHLGDVSSASAHLDVHPNTFRYRLRRAVEIAGLDLDDPVERLVAHLQLHLLDDPSPDA